MKKLAFKFNRNIQWLVIWLASLLIIYGWDLIFLNNTAISFVGEGLVNSIYTAALSVLFSIAFAWLIAILLHIEGSIWLKRLQWIVELLVNMIRSIPQIVGLIIAYLIINFFIQNGKLDSDKLVLLFIAISLSLVMFYEAVDLLSARIKHFKQMDFFHAMKSLGISDFKIIHHEIIWKNSVMILLNKAVSFFGMSFFLQASIDFIVSVGLSYDLSAGNFPMTLGNLLAQIDSKQDLLAVSTVLTRPSYFFELFTTHLQGLSVAFLITITLICFYKLAQDLSRRLT